MKLPQFLLISALAGLSPISAKTWTSADGTQNFEAEYISHTETEVTVIKDSKEVTFKQKLLSKADITWVTEQTNKEVAQPEASDSEDVIHSNAKNYLKKLSGKSYKKFSPTKKPEYYLLYFSASW